MKIRTVVIAAALSAILVGGIGCSAYYAMGGRETPVEVVPVKNISYNNSLFSYSDSIYGSVTSMVSQTISLNPEYTVDEIYVSAGDEVKEGTPLFSYDMTLDEIQLEGCEIELKTLELQLKRYQMELEKYQNMNAAASLATVSPVLTAASFETDFYSADNNVMSDEIIDDDQESESMAVSDPSEGGSGPDIFIEDVEEIGPDAESALRSNIFAYESLVVLLKNYIDEYGSEISASDIEEDLLFTVKFYRENLSDEKEVTVQDSYGRDITVKEYILKDTVTELLSDEEIETLNSIVSLMENYHTYYVELLISEAEKKSGNELEKALKKAREAYEDLSKEARELVSEDLLAQLKSMEEQYRSEGSSGEGSEGEAEYETENDTEKQDEESPEDIDTYAKINTFLLLADNALSDTVQASAIDFTDAIDFYQMYLGTPMSDIINEDNNAVMENYTLSESVLSYLDGFGTEGLSIQSQLNLAYQDLCLEYVKFIVLSLDESTMTRDDLKEVTEIYNHLGTAWTILLNSETPSVNDYLSAYDIALRIRELEPDSENYLNDLSSVYSDYISLSEIQKNLVENSEDLLELYRRSDLPGYEYGEEGTYEEDGADDGFDGYDYYDDDYYDYDYYWSDDYALTASEIREITDELEMNIRECELEIREAKLNLEEEQQIVDNRIVKSTMDGTVISIGWKDGSSDEDYFVKISNSTGLYAKGVISELALDSVSVGDVISGMTDDGDTFTAVIKEISDYPDPYGYGYVYSSDNYNASYYTFYALIDDPESISEGEAELTLSDAFADNGSSIWLDVYYVRKDGSGNSYVCVAGADGRLEKRYVTVGRTYYDWAIEIKSGLSASDLIAFPYGDNVFEGARTREVSSLSAEY